MVVLPRADELQGTWAGCVAGVGRGGLRFRDGFWSEANGGVGWLQLVRLPVLALWEVGGLQACARGGRGGGSYTVVVVVLTP